MKVAKLTSSDGQAYELSAQACQLSTLLWVAMGDKAGEEEEEAEGGLGIRPIDRQSMTCIAIPLPSIEGVVLSSVVGFLEVSS